MRARDRIGKKMRAKIKRVRFMRGAPRAEGNAARIRAKAAAAAARDLYLSLLEGRTLGNQRRYTEHYTYGIRSVAKRRLWVSPMSGGGGVLNVSCLFTRVF